VIIAIQRPQHDVVTILEVITKYVNYLTVEFSLSWYFKRADCCDPWQSSESYFDLIRVAVLSDQACRRQDCERLL